MAARARTTGRRNTTGKVGRRRTITPPDLPRFCDFTCPHAAFAPADTSGACRRDVTVACTLFGRFTTKHAVCLGKQPGRPIS